MKWINEVVKHQEEFIKIIEGMGETFYAQDIVQEFYIKLLKYGKEDKVMIDGSLNMPYLYFILKNLFINYQNVKNKFHKVPLDSLQIAVKHDYIMNTAKETLETKIEQEIKTWHYFDRELFKVYRNQGLSMRQIAKGTDISTQTIFYTLKRCKKKLRNKLGEDYENYINANIKEVK